MRIGFIGCVESSEVGLKALIASSQPGYEVVGVITKKNSSFNSDFIDLSPICEDHSIPYVHANKDSHDSDARFMQSLRPDVIFCIGWSYLLKNNFLSMTEYGVIGFHPAKLPANRGRHPIIWALALGLEKTASTFFKMDLGADSGPIVSQVDINIRDHYGARDLYDEVLNAVSLQVPKIASDLATGMIKYIEQEHSDSNVWRKRTSQDGIVDFRMTAVDIHNLVLALSAPYPGAEVKLVLVSYKIWKSAVTTEVYPRNIEPGRVLEIDQQRILVKTAGVSAIYLWNTELSEQLNVGDYI